jgi:hypothetical protein
MDNTRYNQKLKAYQTRREQEAKIRQWLMTSVSTHWFTTTCKSNKSLSEIYRDLKTHLGTTASEQTIEAKRRCTEATQPSRKARDWQKWITNWEKAMVYGHENIPKVTNTTSWVEDFIKATSLAFPQWGRNLRFSERASIKDGTITYREVAGAFRTDMEAEKLLQPKTAGGAFGPTYVEQDTPDQTSGTPMKEEKECLLDVEGMEEDPSGSYTRAAMTRATARGMGKLTLSKNCFYLFPEKAKSWFRPRDEIVAEVDEALRNDSDLKDRVHALKRNRARSSTRTDGSTSRSDSRSASLPVRTKEESSTPLWLEGRMIGKCHEQFGTAQGSAFSTSSGGTHPLINSAILDSGTTIHIFDTYERFSNHRQARPGDYIWAGSVQVPIYGYGSVDICVRLGTSRQILRLLEVAFCPDMLANLVSLERLGQQGMWWDMEKEPSVIRLRSPPTAVCEVHRHHGQWVLKYIPPTEDKASFITRRNKYTSWTKRKPIAADAMLWHQRLGHPGTQAIEHLVNSSAGVRLVGPTTVECDACGIAKARRQVSKRLRQFDEDQESERLAIDFHDFEPGYGGFSTLMLISDRWSTYIWDFYLQGHSMNGILEALESFFNISAHATTRTQRSLNAIMNSAEMT